jgi:hypothetical protein
LVSRRSDGGRSEPPVVVLLVVAGLALCVIGLAAIPILFAVPQ